MVDRQSRTIRYLGAWVNLELAWEVQLARMQSSVGFACANIRGYSLQLDMSVDAMKQFLMARLRTGLRHADLTVATLTGWDVKYRAAVFAGAGISMGRDLAKEALYILSGMLPLREHQWVMAGEELMATINADYPSSRTTRARCNAHLPRSEWEPKASRADRMLEMLYQHQVEVFQYPQHLRCPEGHLNVIVSQTESAGPKWKAEEVPALFTVAASNRRTKPRVAYVDASSARTPGLPSGCAAVICEDESGTPGKVIDVVAFASRPSGSNFLGESNALLAAIVSTPSDVDLRIVSDCLSAKMSADKGRLREWPSARLLSQYALPQRRRILAAARPVFNLIRKVIEEREASTQIDWVRSHTGAQDPNSIGNEWADKAANDARTAAPAHHRNWKTAGQNQFGMRVQGVEVLGSYRQAMDRSCQRGLVASLAKKFTDPNGAKMQGRLAAEVGHARLLAWCALVRKMKDSRVLKFALLAMTRHLPSREVLRIQQARVDGRPIAPQASDVKVSACTLCRHLKAETNDHAICECQHPLQRHLRGLAAREAREYLLKQGAIAPARVVGSARVSAWFSMPADFEDGVVPPLWICAKVPAKVRSRFCEGGQLAEAIGVAPKDIDLLLAWTWNGERWLRCSLSEVDERIQRLSAILINRAWARCGSTMLRLRQVVEVSPGQYGQGSR